MKIKYYCLRNGKPEFGRKIKMSKMRTTKEKNEKS
jgi:hypothetical protein